MNVRGLPPYPLIKDMEEDSVEYLTQVLDHFQAGSSEDGVTNMGQIVGHLVEYRQQQDSGKTEWVKPEKKE